MKKLILISGKARSGKNQLAEYLTTEFQSQGLTTTTESFAAPLKDQCKENFKGLKEILDNISEEIKTTAYSLVNAKDEIFQRGRFIALENALNKLKIEDEHWYENKTSITRNILQIVGTNIVRNVDDNWWSKQLRSKVISSQKDVILVSDCRFPGEIETLSDLNYTHLYETFTIRVNRNINNDGLVSVHSSETALDEWTIWDYIVDNNGMLKDLKESARIIVEYILGKNRSKEEINYFTKLTI